MYARLITFLANHRSLADDGCVVPAKSTRTGPATATAGDIMSAGARKPHALSTHREATAVQRPEDQAGSSPPGKRGDLQALQARGRPAPRRGGHPPVPRRPPGGDHPHPQPPLLDQPDP